MPCSRTQHGLTRVRLEPPTSGSLDPEALTTRPSRSPQIDDNTDDDDSTVSSILSGLETRSLGLNTFGTT